MRVALLTVSDSAAAGRASDLSGPLLHKLVAEGGRTVMRADIVPDDRQLIAEWLCMVSDVLQVDLALTSGGTGIAPRDVTPEATVDVVDFEVPGIAEAIRAAGVEKTPRAMLSRAIAGVRKATLIVNLSGSPRAVTEQWSVIEPIVGHAVETINGHGYHKEADEKRQLAADVIPPDPRVEYVPQPDVQRANTLVGQPLSELIGEEKLAEIREEQARRRREKQASKTASAVKDEE